MTQEEKAKAYDEAYKKVAVRFGSNVADEIFLKESEDEKIRKSIIAIINNYVDNSNTFKPKMLAWLKKQGDANKEYWRGYREGKQEILDKYAELEK